MLLRLELENWMSFRDNAAFSMVASREKRHRHRLPRVEKFRLTALPIAAIYGGNASGKSNYIRALYFMQRFVVRGAHPDAPIAIKPFLLDPSHASRPTRFSIQLLIDELVYELMFTVSTRAVLQESLTRITSARKTVLYQRTAGEIVFDPHFLSQQGDEQESFLRFAFKGTRDNELFLTNSVSLKIEAFKPVYEWFRDQLYLIHPDSSFAAYHLLTPGSSPWAEQVSQALLNLDTGITGLDMKEIKIDDLQLPSAVMAELVETVSPEKTVLLTDNRRQPVHVSLGADGRLMAGRLVARHFRSDGSETNFEISEESDGSQRLIDLLPAFCELKNSTNQSVYIIDELDRSLHTLLTRQLLEGYLNSCTQQTRSQLIFSTHDLLLMDQDLLRRDEMWVMERAHDGTSSLFSFSENAEMRYDKDIRRSYLQGRLGGIPQLLHAG